ncbi:MAG: hypothetical protein H6891_09200 [Brucellaceae bacterium]|nr:hypothetical protein [Brucellaceae bacterium]
MKPAKHCRTPRRLAAALHRQRPAAGHRPAGGGALSARLSDEQAARTWLSGIGLTWRTEPHRWRAQLTTATGDIVHLRLSGNAPEMRCYAETADAQASAALAARALEHVATYDLG